MLQPLQRPVPGPVFQAAVRPLSARSAGPAFSSVNTVKFGVTAMPGKTGIVATLGPASESREKIRALMEAGVNVFRLNFSHGKQETHGEWMERIRDVQRELKNEGKLARPVSILADVQGPKIRVGTFENGPLELVPGDTVYLTREASSSEHKTIPVTFSPMIDALQKGQRILIADGTMELKVTQAANANQGKVACEVVRGGTLSNSKGINLPNVQLNTPALSDKDRSDIRFAVEKGVDAIAISFVRSAQDMQEARQLVDSLPNGKKIKLVAKIEKPEAVEPDMLPKIVAASDGIMVARGDLGIEVDVVRIPELQETILAEAKKRGRPVIVATQMLESMLKNTQPSRADVSDIADAVKDQADFVMLSGETSVGDYPVEAVRMMKRIVTHYEPQRTLQAFLQRVMTQLRFFLGDFLAMLKGLLTDKG